MNIDISTLIASYIIAYTILVLCFFFMNTLNKQIQKAAMLWAIGYSFALISMVLISLHNYLPYNISVVLVNVLNFSSRCFLFIGLYNFQAKHPEVSKSIFLISIYTALFIIFTYLYPSYRLRNIIGSSFAGFLNLLIVIFLITNVTSNSNKRYNIFAATFFGLSTVTNIGRLILSIIKSPGDSFFTTANYEEIFLLIILFTIIGQGLSLALLISEKLNSFLVIRNKNLKILMKEMNHRVKNNLAIISGLIFLKQVETENEELLSYLETINSRIQSIQLIHDKLSYGELVSTVNIRNYFDDLINEILNSSIQIRSTIDYTLKIQEILFPVRELVSLALITNELLLNSIKHAFPAQENSRIEISIYEKNKTLTFTYNDFGSGIVNSISNNNPESMGLKLIKNLSEQLYGIIDLERADSSIFKLVFPLPDIESI